MAARIPEALPATHLSGGITDTFDYDYTNHSILNDDSSSTAIILYPRSATVFAAICASIFTVVGIGGKNCSQYSHQKTMNLHYPNHELLQKV